MTERERLIELLDIIIQPGEKTLGDIADYLLANGVIVPPCKVGDRAYKVVPKCTARKEGAEKALEEMNK